MNAHRILNLGAGTQSSVLLVMADRGIIPPVDVAIFADTQAEPREVYEHLDWLEKQVRTPVVRVSAGNLEADAIAFRRNRYSEDPSTGRKGYASLPLYVLNPDGTQGIIRRRCTSEYKIAPVRRFIRRELLKVEDGARVPAGVNVVQVFGISFDERKRMRASDVGWSTHDYPLVDMRLRRENVIAIAERWFPDRVFPRSACVFCPYHSNDEWRRLRDEHPSEWDRAVRFDAAIRDADQQRQEDRGMLVGLPFVHRQCVPLDQVDLRTDVDHGQGLLDFGNECEGMCGV